MFWEIYSSLCAKKGLSANKVAKELNISSGSVTNWKNGAIPNNSTIKNIADYFEVTTDYLLGRVNKNNEYKTENDIKDCLLILKEKPELYKLLYLLKNESKENIEKAVAIIEILSK